MRAGRRGLSAYVTRPLAAQLELDRLGDYLAAAKKANGPVSDQMLDQVCADMAQADAVIGYVR